MTTPLEALEALNTAIGASRVLGLDVTRAEAVRAEASSRLGIAPDTYVAAFVGGTGVGKSSIVNALAGRDVSTAGARRPTTARAVAWVPGSAATGAADLRPLLERLDAAIVDAPSAAGPLRNVVIVDLPDIDSLAPEHRAAVESVLPKVDVVAWVTDPEKYADAVFHDGFLRDWMPRLDRQVVILNKADRLSADAERSVLADLAGVIRRELPALQGRLPPVIVTRAAAGPDGVLDLARWLGQAVDAKQVIADRVVAGAAAAVADLAGLAGVPTADAAGRVAPIIPEATRRHAIDAATDAVLHMVDVPGVERRAIASTRALARRRGTGPIGLVTSALYRVTGRHRAAADPAGYLRAWRQRGGLARAGEAVRAAINAALPGIPASLRSQYTGAAGAGDLESRIAQSVDAVIARQGSFEPPTSRLWPVLGLLQSANTLLLILVAAWLVIWIIARPAVSSYDLPVVGAVPAPLAWLVIGLVLGYALARGLSLHAGWIGRRWARGIGRAIRDAVGERVAAEAFGPLDRIESARAALGVAWRNVRR